jgi:hypothetical protein
VTWRNPIVKVLAWKNRGLLGTQSWEIEVTREDETREMIIGLNGRIIEGFIDIAARTGVKVRKD